MPLFLFFFSLLPNEKEKLDMVDGGSWSKIVVVDGEEKQQLLWYPWLSYGSWHLFYESMLSAGKQAGRGLSLSFYPVACARYL